MHLVNRDRRIEGIGFRALCHPALVLPLIVQLPDNRGILGRLIVIETEWVDLLETRSVLRLNVVPVTASLQGTSDSPLPDTASHR